MKYSLHVISSYWHRSLLACVVFVTALALSGCATNPPVAKARILDIGAAPTSTLYIGNSFFYYNNSLHGTVGQLINAGMPGYKHRASSITISGSGFDWHDVDSYFRPNAVGSYSFLPGNKVAFNKLDKLFDVTIMMDCSQCPLNPQLKGIFKEYAKKHSDTVRKHGARPVFFMSWAYQDVPSMTQELADAYTQAGIENAAFVIPAGLAFARSIAIKPDLNLYVADKRHPSPAGSYLAACTTYAALFKKSPVGNPYLGGLDPGIARHLQTVAWETVQAYYKP